jgi:hypothetical protein
MRSMQRGRRERVGVEDIYVDSSFLRSLLPILGYTLVLVRRGIRECNSSLMFDWVVLSHIYSASVS